MRKRQKKQHNTRIDNMTTTCSAPGKIYLFGEHAVVYGKRAIASAINLRTAATVAESDQTTISSILGTTGIDYMVNPYISRSAAAVIATLGALNAEFRLMMDSATLAEVGHRIERDVQGSASPTDTAVSTMGGTMLVNPGVSSSRLRLIECDIVIGDTEEFSSTKELVGNVRILHEDYPEVMDSIFDTIDNLSGIGVPLIEKGDYRSVGELMNIDHGLLDAIGVGSAKLSRLVHAARDAGAYGAKITGAGGGGCIVSLVRGSGADAAGGGADAVASAINDAGGRAIITKASEDGLVGGSKLYKRTGE
jgi:mevalonate kinase